MSNTETMSSYQIHLLLLRLERENLGRKIPAIDDVRLAIENLVDDRRKALSARDAIQALADSQKIELEKLQGEDQKFYRQLVLAFAGPETSGWEAVVQAQNAIEAMKGKSEPKVEPKEYPPDGGPGWVKYRDPPAANATIADCPLKDALARAALKEGQIPHLVQVTPSDWDQVVLAKEVKRLQDDIADWAECHAETMIALRELYFCVQAEDAIHSLAMDRAMDRAKALIDREAKP